MPHSSGGGSHSGGSHSSSSHSHSSGGGSHRSGSHYSSTTYHGNVGPHRSKKYFPGSYKYVYYRHKKPVYYYSSSAHEGENKLGVWDWVNRIFILLCYLPFIVVSVIMLNSAVDMPRKIKANYDNSIVIKDTANVLDSTKLESALEKFRDRTGIAPAVITVNNEQWEKYFDSMEDYAYDLYVANFDDENHWLIVYSEPEEPDENFNDWYWEGMQGDNTDGIITSSALKDFNSAMQKNLTARTRLTVGDAIAQTFEDTESSFMKARIYPVMLTFPIAIIAFVTVHAALMLGLTPDAVRRRKSTLVPNEEEQERYNRTMQQMAADGSSANVNDYETANSSAAANQAAAEAACEYCGGIYVRGTVTNCPHCGAPLKLQNSQQ